MPTMYKIPIPVGHQALQFHPTVAMLVMKYHATTPTAVRYSDLHHAPFCPSRCSRHNTYGLSRSYETLASFHTDEWCMFVRAPYMRAS